MSKSSVYPYFDFESVQNGRSSHYKVEMENGFTAHLGSWYVSDHVETHLNITDTHGVPTYETKVDGIDVKYLVNWANEEINREFPRRLVLEQAVEYQKRVIADHQAILDAVSAELSELDEAYGTPEM